MGESFDLDYEENLKIIGIGEKMIEMLNCDCMEYMVCV